HQRREVQVRERARYAMAGLSVQRLEAPQHRAAARCMEPAGRTQGRHGPFWRLMERLKPNSCSKIARKRFNKRIAQLRRSVKMKKWMSLWPAGGRVWGFVVGGKKEGGEGGGAPATTTTGGAGDGKMDEKKTDAPKMDEKKGAEAGTTGAAPSGTDTKAPDTKA